MRKYKEYITDKLNKRNVSRGLDKLEAQQGHRDGEANMEKKNNHIQMSTGNTYKRR